MIDADRQVPTPTAEAWLIDLAVLGGPKFVVLARSSEEARRRLVEHLRRSALLPLGSSTPRRPTWNE